MMRLPAIGTPYAFPSHPPESFDCWTLVEFIRASAGRRTELAADHAVDTPETMQAAISAEQAVTGWAEVERGAEEDLDVVVMGAAHVGVYVRGSVVHTTPDSGVSCHAFSRIRRCFATVRVYRP